VIDWHQITWTKIKDHQNNFPKNILVLQRVTHKIEFFLTRYYAKNARYLRHLRRQMFYFKSDAKVMCQISFILNKFNNIVRNQIYFLYLIRKFNVLKIKSALKALLTFLSSISDVLTSNKS